MVLFGNSPIDFQCKLDLLKLYCDRAGVLLSILKQQRLWFSGSNFLGTVFSYNGPLQEKPGHTKGLKAFNVLLIY
jgi:hypothetical protein